MASFFYLAPYAGDGQSIETAYRPAGGIGNWGGWHFREQVGYAVLMNPAPNAVGGNTFITADPTAILPVAMFQSAFGVSLNPDTIYGILKQLAAQLWPAVAPNVGAALLARPAAGVKLGSFSDNFNRSPDENPLSGGGNWGAVGGGTQQMQLASNQCKGSGSGDNMSRASGVAGWGADQYGQIDFISGVPSGSSKLGGACTRLNGGSKNGYANVTDGGAGFGGIYKFVSASASQVAAYTGSWSTETCMLQSVGNTHTLFKGGSQVAQGNDGSITAADPPGFCGTDTTEVFDNFMGDNLAMNPYTPWPLRGPLLAQ